MRRRRPRPAIALALILAAGRACLAGDAGTEADNRSEPPPEPAQVGPEFRVRTHPGDTFKPTEEVPEDFPVAFPVDI